MKRFKREVQMRCARYGLIAILLSIVVLPLSAWATNLQDLIDFGESITAGDKLFTNFSGFVIQGGGHPSKLGDLIVSGETHGLSFSTEFEPGTIMGFSVASFFNLEVGFDVTVTQGHHAITGIAVGIPFVSIPESEFVSAAVSARGGTASIGASGEYEAPLSSAVAPLSSPATSMHVETELAASGAGFDALTRFFSYDISFVQSESVPEPSTALLLVFGAGLITAIAHRVGRVYGPSPRAGWLHRGR